MATFTAIVPHANYNETATIPDEAWAQVVTSVRQRFGQVPSGPPAEDGTPAPMRDMTEKECIKRILGGMLQGWLTQAALDKVEQERAAIKVTPSDWVVS